MRLTLAAALLSLSLAAQTKLPPTPAEYGQWETLAGGGGGRGGAAQTGLSPDGKWLAYGINRSNGQNELRVANIASGSVKTTAFGAQPAFSADSKWLAFSIGYSEEAAEKMRKDNKPVENKLALMNLETGEQTVIDAIQSFSFSPAGTWIAMRHYRAQAPANNNAGGRGGRGGRGGGNDGADDNTPGSTLILRNLAT